MEAYGCDFNVSSTAGSYGCWTKQIRDWKKSLAKAEAGNAPINWSNKSTVTNAGKRLNDSCYPQLKIFLERLRAQRHRASSAMLIAELHRLDPDVSGGVSVALKQRLVRWRRKEGFS